ncbi:MAG: hypothetical protein QOD29_2535, partial [Alphaproteobacteria bacterium]|nr:hypothetical protein [Alphaproteobacteria bacterium]
TLLAISMSRLENPVTLPPGCDRLLTRPPANGSAAPTMTIGTVLGKGAHLLPVDGESADQLIILEHRHVDRRPRAAKRDRRGGDIAA